MQNLAKYIDHTILKATTTVQDVVVLCNEAITYNFKAVCIPPVYVGLAQKMLAGTDVSIAIVVGFPLGYSSLPAKLAEIENAILHGAKEIDLVHNIAAIKNSNWEYAVAEVEACTKLTHKNGCLIKVILETGSLTDAEIIHSCRSYAPLGVDFIKTSTGFSDIGATVHAVQLIKQNTPADMGIKASGGIKTAAFANELIAAGATRLGCSASVAIVKEDKPL